MADEARLEPTEHGLVPQGEGWFVLNAREAPWYGAEGRSAICWFEGDVNFAQLGINVSVIAPGEAMAMYHWEADQEDFLVVAGEAPAIVIAVGARDRSIGPDWGGYPVNETALRHGAGVEVETTVPDEAYASLKRRQPTRYKDGWLPG